MRLMPVTDAMFLWGESREMPMHIGGINLYTLPEGVDETEWLNDQLALLRQSEGLRLACCRFGGHRDRVFPPIGGPQCKEGSSAASSSLRR